MDVEATDVGLFERLSGSAGVTTAGRNQYALWTRPRTTPTDPATPLQQARRAIFAEEVARWTTLLTDAQRNAWRAYARTRSCRLWTRPRTLTGQAAWVQARVLRRLTTVGPTTFSPPDPSPRNAFRLGICRYFVAINQTRVNWTAPNAWASDVNAVLLFWVSPAQPATVNRFYGPWRFYSWVRGQVPPGVTSPQFLLGYPWSPPVDGQRAWIRARLVTGRNYVTPTQERELIVR
jgi:hypothetical protein